MDGLGPDPELLKAALANATPQQAADLLRQLQALAAGVQLADYQPQEVAPTADAPAREEVGAQIGPYRLLQELGEGGMGTVFLAEQQHPVERRVAIKIIKAGMDSRQVLARFEAEEQALAMMDHPNIAKVFDAGVTQAGRPYFVMELVKGIPITQYCDQEHLTPRERMELFIPVCQAVQHAHQKGIIHRDLKPSNVIVALYDGKPVPKVIDFGVAKATGAKLTERTMFTEVGQMVGTLEYMAPEQAELNNLDIDTRSDIYSLGVLLYELLTGSPPFSSRELRSAAFDEMLRIIREVEPPKPSTKLSSSDELPAIAAKRKLEPQRLTKLVSGELDWIVMKCLEKERSRRYETATGLAAEIEHYLHDEPVLAGPPSRAYRLRKLVRRNKAAIVTVCVVTVSLLAGLCGTSWQAIRATRAERRAQDEAAVATAVNKFLRNDLLILAGTEEQLSAEIEPEPDLKLRTLLDRALARVDARFADQPRVRAEVQNTLAMSFLSIGRYMDAVRLLGQVLEYQKAALGVDDADTLITMSNLAIACQRAGQLEEAVGLAEETVRLQKKRLGPRHSSTLTSMSNLASVYFWAGQIDKAVPLLEETLEMTSKVLGPEHPTTLSAMGTLCAYYCNSGRLQEALPIAEKVLTLRKKVLGPEHPETLDSIGDLASVYWHLQQFDRCIPLFEETVRLEKKVKGEHHPSILWTLANLGANYIDAGRVNEALPLLEDAYRLSNEKLGATHPTTLLSRNNLAVSYEYTGQWDKVLLLREEALRLSNEMHGPDHSETLHCMEKLALAYRESGQFQRALELYNAAFELSKATFGLEHLDTLRAATGLAFACNYAGETDKAVLLGEEVLRLMKAKLGPEHSETLACLNNLVFFYNAANQSDKAVPLYEEAFLLVKAKLGPEHPNTLKVQLTLVQTYFESRQLDKALSFGAECVSTCRTRFQPDDPQFAGVLAGVSLLFLTHSQFTAAESYLRECLIIREKSQPDAWTTFNTQSMLGGALVGQAQQLQVSDAEAATAKLAEAEPLLVRGYDGLQQRADPIPAKVRTIRLTEALQRLVDLYTAWGKPDEAAKWQQKLDEAKAVETQAAEAKAEDAQAVDAETEETTPDERKTDETHGEEAKPAVPAKVEQPPEEKKTEQPAEEKKE